MSKHTILSFEPKQAINGKTHRDNREFVESFTLFSFDNVTPGQDGQLSPKTPVEIRIYKGGRTYYCCAWVYGQGVPAHGSASGRNYNKAGAVWGALQNAGFDYKVENGCETDPYSFLHSSAKYFGIQSFFIHHSHA